MLDEGLAELVRVVDAAREHTPGLLVADLKIARGLDYYTGVIYEAVLTDPTVGVGRSMDPAQDGAPAPAAITEPAAAAPTITMNMISSMMVRPRWR